MRYIGSRLAGSPVPSPRAPRAYSPFNRRAGLGRLLDDRLGLSFVCSVIVHAMIVILVLRVTDLPSGSGGAAISSALSWVDLAAPEPARGTAGAPATPATRMTPRSSSPVLPIPSRSASTVTPADRPRAAITAATRPQVPTAPPASSPVSSKAAQDQPRLAGPDMHVQGSVTGLPSMPGGDKPLGPARPGAESEVVAVDPKGSVETSAVMPQPAKTLTMIPTIDGLDQRALLTPVGPRRQAPPSVEPTPQVKSKPLVDPQPAEMHPEVAPASGDTRLSQQSTTPTTSSVSGQEMTSSVEASSAAIPRAEPGEPNRPRILQVAGDHRAGSAVGAAPGRAKIRFDGPRIRVTQKDLETVTGKIMGGTTDRLLVYVNEVPTELAIGAGAFQTSVPLKPGLNQLRAVGTGPEGIQVEDSISIEYAPPASNGVALTSPTDGLVVTPEDPPIVVVEGRVDDKSATTLWLVVNDRRIVVRASEGRFRKVLPMVEPALRVWAETSRSGESGARSQIVTVRTTGQRAPSAVLVMEWPSDTQNLDVEVSALWRAHPDRLDEAAQPVRLTSILRPSGTAPADVFWLRNVRAGVYAMIVRYRGLPPNAEVQPTLYVAERDGLATRTVRPIRLDGVGKAVLTRVLLPQGVLWEQDGWFSGSSESVDTVTKFRFPEGINWVERKADLQ